MIITQINDSRVMTDYPKSGHIIILQLASENIVLLTHH